MADNQITPFQLTDQFTMDNFNQRINETNIALQNKADKDRVVNPNLLDNWYFANPVDQRDGYVVPPGIASYYDKELTQSAGDTSRYFAVKQKTASYAYFEGSTGNTYYFDPSNAVRGYTDPGYGIDRWLSHEASNTTLIYDDHITISRQHAQVIDNYANLVGKQVTISALTNLGLITATGVCTNNDGTQVQYNDGNGHDIVIYNNGSYHGFQVNNTKGGTLDLYGVKIELGSQQTLAHQENGNWVLNELPDYGEQLARCQRYFYRINSSDKQYHTGSYTILLPFVANSGGTRVAIQVPSPLMRKKPSISASGMLYVKSSAGAFNKDISSLTLGVQSNNEGGTVITLDTTDFPANTFGVVAMDGCDIILNAEL